MNAVAVPWARRGIVCLVLCLPHLAAAGPIEFGKAELDRALEARGEVGRRPVADVRPGAPESWSISAGAITGGDERGLMYGLLEAAEQIRRNGQLAPARGKPAAAMRGIRTFIHNQDLEEDWYFDRGYWDRFFAMLARNRFNRFNLVFAHQTRYLAPPYPFWVAADRGFPGSAFPGSQRTPSGRPEPRHAAIYLAGGGRSRDRLHARGVGTQCPDRAPSRWSRRRKGSRRRTSDRTAQRALARSSSQLCPAIRSVQMRTNVESGIPDRVQEEFYRNYVFPAIREARGVRWTCGRGVWRGT